MRTLVAALAVLALAAASAQADVVVNDIVDTLLERFSASERIASLPDLEEVGEMKLLFWDTTAQIEASHGALLSNVTLRRFGDAVLSVDRGNLALSAEIGFDEAECSYDYKTVLGTMRGPSGRFSAKVGTTTMTATVKLFLTSVGCSAGVTSIAVGQLGPIELKKGGSTLSNDMYRKLLVDMLVDSRSKALKNFINTEILNPTEWDCNSLLPPGVIEVAKALPLSA